MQAEAQASQQQITRLSIQKADLEKDKARLIEAHSESMGKLKQTYEQDRQSLQQGKQVSAPLRQNPDKNMS